MVQGHHRGGSEGALYPPYAQPPPPPPIPQHQRPSMQWHAGVQLVVLLWFFCILHAGPAACQMMIAVSVLLCSMWHEVMNAMTNV